MVRARSGPTLEHRVLAEQVRLLRERAGVSLEEAASALGKHPHTVRRLEQAATAPDAGQITTLLHMYGAAPEVTEEVMSLLLEAMQPGWWHPYREVLRPWEQETIGIESAASLVRIWDPGLVPELLRTPAYAAEVARIQRLSPPQVDRRLELLAERQHRLASRNCVVWAILPQAVLHTAVGSPQVMREQREALAAAAEGPRTSVQVVPLTASPHALTGSAPLTLLRVLPQAIPDFLVVHGPAREDEAAVYDDVAIVDRYRLYLDQASAAAPDPRTPLSLPAD